MSQEVLQSVLALRSKYEADPYSVLNVAPNLPPVHASTPVTEARRNYMRLAAMIHPDKFTGKGDLVGSATEAFQILVKVFEIVANPQLRAAATKSGVKPAQAKTAAPEPKKRAPKQRAATQRRKPKKTSDDDDDDISSDSESSSDSDNDSSGYASDDSAAVAAEATKPKLASVTRTLRPGKEVLQRDRPAKDSVPERRTVVKCPRCVTSWQPDEPRQYSLFMGYGLKVHCQLCLFVFGCATAVHGCPHCSKPFDYDVSLYDTCMQCNACKKPFRFAYYPVLAEMVSAIRATEAAAAAKHQQQSERAERAAARRRSDDGGDEDERLLELIGRCVVEEVCPICEKNVSRKHRDHVEACMKNPPAAKKKRATKCCIVGERKQPAKRSRSSAASASSSSKGKRTSSSKPPVSSAPRRRRKDDDSD